LEQLSEASRVRTVNGSRVLQRRIALTLLAGAFAAQLAVAAEVGKEFPQRPIRLVTPFAPGGSTDAVGRLLAPKLSERLGQNVIIENRPGAGGMIGSAMVAKATPDGHTLLMPSGAFTAQAASVKKLPYDALNDFEWVTMMLTYPFVVIVKADSPMRTMADLITEAKRRPSKLNYASVGIGSVFHLAAELFNSMARVETVHVPFKGGAEPVAALVGGQIDVIFTTLTGSTAHINAKRVWPLAVTSLERSPHLPDVPTAAQTLPGFEVTSFAGISAPRGTPRPVIDRLNKAFREALTDADINKRLTDLGGDVRPSTPAELRRHAEAEINKWRRIVAERKIEVQ
jgi:tripartite-type tricarboxylate transporter receptor subunit TctC